jgi:hypothetical protein
MKRFKIITLALALFALLIAAPAQAVMQEFWANVYTWDGKQSSDGKPVLTRVTSGITFKVLVVDSDTAETLYYPGIVGLTSLTNPVSTTNFAATGVCNDRVAFKVDPTDSTNDRYVDLLVVDTNGGYTAFVENFDRFQHTIVIDARPNIMHHGTIWFGGVTSDTDTGINFLPKTMVHDVRVEVVTVADGATFGCGLISTGTGGAATGFRQNVLMTTAGFVADTGVITAGTVSTDYYPATTYGSLLYTALTGTGTADLDSGGRTYIGHVVNSGKADGLTYLSGSTAAAGYLHYWITRLR